MLLAVCSKPVRVISGAAILIAPLDPTYLLFFPRVRLCFGMIGLRPYCSASVYSLIWTFDFEMGMLGTRIPFVFTRPAVKAES